MTATNMCSNFGGFWKRPPLLAKTFKRRRRANTAMPAKTAMPNYLTSYEAEVQIWTRVNCFDVHKSSYFTNKKNKHYC